MSVPCNAPEQPVRVVHAEVEEYLRAVDADRFHAVLCDPPYGLSEPLAGEDAAAVLAQWMAEGQYVRTKGRKKPAKPGGTDVTSRLAGGGFMGAQWDAFVPGPRLWHEVLRGTRPGGYLLAFAGSRTSGWMEIALMLAGWEVLDTIQWWYAEGFPKGGDVGKRVAETSPGEGAVWSDWSTTLKPAHEPIIVARKPLGEASVGANLLRWRTGAMNVGACRLAAGDELRPAVRGGFVNALEASKTDWGVGDSYTPNAGGRWPTNLMLTHSEACGDECAEGCPVRLLDEQSGERKSGSRAAGVRSGLGYSGKAHGDGGPAIVGSSGGASRFFFSAKASPADRAEGAPDGANKHPTVKPVPLIRELARLVTAQPVSGWSRSGEGFTWEDRPPGEVLVPFAGSGSELVACALEGLRAVGVEREAEYHATAEARVAHALRLVAKGRCPKHWRRRGE